MTNPIPDQDNYVVLAPEEVTELAHTIHGLRPGWHVRSLATLLDKLAATYDGRLLRRAAITAAKDASIKTPAGIEWTLGDLVNPPTNRTRREPCAVCGRPEDRCRWDRPPARNPEHADDHTYQPKSQAYAQAAARRPA